MNRTRVAVWGALIGSSLLVTGAGAQEPERLTAEEAVRLAVRQHPAVAAARSRLEASLATQRGARAPYNPLVELAPGVGFTNGNALLSQQFDIGGRRSAQSRVATGLREAAQAELELARLQVAANARTAYFDLVRVQAVEAAALEAVALTRQIQTAVKKRVEIGEAPQVQATRLEIEVARAEQEVARAAGERRGRMAGLNLLLGRPAESPLATEQALTLPEEPDSVSGLVEQALRQRPELAATRGLVQARRGDVAVARAERRPELFAEMASDIWSLDRNNLRSRNLGIQARLTFPLFDRGRLRGGVDRAQSGVREQEAELAAIQQTLSIEVQRAAAELAATREVARNYQAVILPRTQELLLATRAGFESGLSSFLEVLEAQRLVRQTQTEYLSALFDTTRARISLDRALGAVPGLAPSGSATSPSSNPTPARSPRR